MVSFLLTRGMRRINPMSPTMSLFSSHGSGNDHSASDEDDDSGQAEARPVKRSKVDDGNNDVPASFALDTDMAAQSMLMFLAFDELSNNSNHWPPNLGQEVEHHRSELYIII